VDEFREILRCSPTKMDLLWSMGWRHFGTYFFSSTTAWSNGRTVNVLPLRIDLAKFSLSRAQRRTLKRNADVSVEFAPAVVDAERESLFQRHKARFRENVPDTLYDFLSFQPDRVPCQAKMCSVLHDDRLLATSYFDLGAEAISAVYAMFDPDESRRGLGILMILKEIEFANQRGYRYLYTGYCYDQPSFYDYKRRFRGTEYLDWATKQFRPLAPDEER
jgi:arginyl-tRNA--protein-N-Asp/Glu arginylyltransferase